MEGDLDEIIDALREQDRKNRQSTISFIQYK